MKNYVYVVFTIVSMLLAQQIFAYQNGSKSMENITAALYKDLSRFSKKHMFQWTVWLSY
jgi:hypothetical protein